MTTMTVPHAMELEELKAKCSAYKVGRRRGAAAGAAAARQLCQQRTCTGPSAQGGYEIAAAHH
jgi:hypothetical protein